MSDEKRIIVTGMKILSPFCKTRLEVGMTIFAINGVFEFENVEQAEQVVDEAPDIVTIIAGEMKDGLLTEFTTIGEIDHHKKWGVDDSKTCRWGANEWGSFMWNVSLLERSSQFG